MSSSSGKKHDVFVANIKHGTPDEQLTELFASVPGAGPVLSLRHVSDKAGKPKGNESDVFNGLFKCH